MKTQTYLTKINEENTISVIKWEETNKYELAHIENGEISYKYMNDVQQFDSIEEVHEEMAELASEILAEAFGGRTDVDHAVEINAYRYDIWVWVSCTNGKLEYDCTTVHQDFDDEEHTDANKAIRKTWKGIVNYIEKYRY